MKLVQMAPGHGDLLLAEGDPEVDAEAELLIAEFRRQLDLGMWAAVPVDGLHGRREATMVRDFDEIPRDTERVVFFPPAAGGSPATEIAAERRAIDLLAAVAGPEAARMYADLGFLAVRGAGGHDDRYCYLVYPQRALVAVDRERGEPLGEYCVRFRDGGERLPDADDVLAKWIALHGDERGLLARANLSPLGRQLDPAVVRRDVAALRAWE